MDEKKAWIHLAIFLFLLIGCHSFEQEQQWLAQNINDFEIAVSELEEGGGFMMVARGGDIYGELEPIFLETPQDPLTAIVLNGADGDQSITYLLKIFYNYEEVFFRIGSSEYMSEFVFSIDAGYRFDIPIYLDLPLTSSNTNSISKLTAGLFVYPEQLAMINLDADEENFIRFWNNNILNFEINYGYDAPIILTMPEYEDVTTIVDMPLASISVTQFFDFPYVEFEPGFLDVEWMDSLELLHLQTTPGESIELAFVANLHSSVTEGLQGFVLISMIDWQQVIMSDQPYLYISTDPTAIEISQFGHFFVDAPNDPGFYEFVMLAIPNPTAPLSWGNYFPLEIARFTIEVVDQ